MTLPMASISGIITDESGALMQLADICLEQDETVVTQTKTDKSGSYQLDVYDVSGIYNLSATSGELGSRKFGIKLAEGEQRDLDIVISESISISGSLSMLDEEKTPHDAVAIQAVSVRSSIVASTVVSGSDGKYRFVNLRSGEYRLRCQVIDGYIYYQDTDETLIMTPYESDTGDEGDILTVEQLQTVSDINFHFAPFKKGVWKTHTYLDGLAGEQVSSTCIPSDGTIWIGTHGGISRYDGKEFISFGKNDGLPHDSVLVCYVDIDDSLWFGTRDGVSHYDGEKFINYTAADGLASDDDGVSCVKSICRDSHGNMWFGTGWVMFPGGGVSRYDGKEFVNFTTEDGLPDNKIHCICRAPDDTMWFGTASGICYYDDKSEKFVRPIEMPEAHVLAGYCDPEGVLWFGTLDGVLRYDGRDAKYLTRKDGLVSSGIVDRVMDIYCDSDGIMWFGTWFGVARYDGRGFVNFTISDGLANNNVRGTCQTPDGTMWFGNFAGVSQYDCRTLLSLTNRDGLLSNGSRGMCLTPNEHIWFVANSGISRYDGEQFTNFFIESDIGATICCDSKGIVWSSFWGNEGGIYCHDGNKLIKPTNVPQRKEGTLGVFSTPDGFLWFSIWGWGLFRYDGENMEQFKRKNGLAGNMVNFVSQDANGNTWFGTDNGVSCYDGYKFHKPIRETDGLSCNWVNAIHCMPDGSVWFVGGNITHYKDGKLINYTTADGLACIDVISVYSTSDGTVWFGTKGGGVSRYDGNTWTSLDVRDGLSSYVNWIHENDDGSLMFGTSDNGIVSYRPNFVPPEVYIVSVETDREYTNIDSVPPVGTGERIAIRCSSIDFKTVPEKRQYRYRIKEIDADWGKSTREDTFRYTFDEPGTYTFEVQAIDRDLNYSEPALLELEVVLDSRSRKIIQLEEHIRQQELAEMARIRQELANARQIQESLLPEKSPEIEGFEVAGLSCSAKEVSGDFYTYLPLRENTGIALADVTGKSVKAAMVAAMTNGMLNAEIKIQEKLWNTPSSILRELNTSLKPHLLRGMYTAMSLCILNPSKGGLVFSNAGMPYPIVKHGDYVWELIANGMPLGLVDGAEYEDINLDLGARDFVIFCSDGVIEATDAGYEMYLTERLIEAVERANRDLSAQEMVDWLMADIREFTGNVEQFDDITVVVLKCNE